MANAGEIPSGEGKNLELTGPRVMHSGTCNPSFDGEQPQVYVIISLLLIIKDVCNNNV